MFFYRISYIWVLQGIRQIRALFCNVVYTDVYNTLESYSKDN